MRADTLLSVHGLSVRFGGLQAVNGLSMEIKSHEIVSLIGPNGAGKTTVLNLLSGFVRPTAGEITFENGRITGFAPYKIAAAGIRRTFQQNSLMFDLTVFENVKAGLHARTHTGLIGSFCQTGSFRSENARSAAEVDEILHAIGMSAQATLLARNLPFGDQRKLGIGIAMAGRPRLLLLDEPAAGLNPDESEQLTRLIRRLRDDGMTIVLVEHDMRVVMGVSDRIIVLSRGEKLAEGTGPEIVTNEQVLRAYLGDGSWTMPAN